MAPVPRMKQVPRTTDGASVQAPWDEDTAVPMVPMVFMMVVVATVPMMLLTIIECMPNGSCARRAGSRLLPEGSGLTPEGSGLTAA